MKKLKIKKNAKLNERQVADIVAYEILQKEKKEKHMIWLFLFLFVLLVFSFSYFLFSKVIVFSDSRIEYKQNGSILFSYEEGTNAINIVEALPTVDSLGKTLSAKNEYFIFRVAVEVNSSEQSEVTYEISLRPEYGTLDPKYVRVYLLKNGNEVLINNKAVNNFNDLVNSTIRDGSKFLYKTTVSKSANDVYTFKMWVSDKYELDEVKRTFKCYVDVDAY